MTSTLPTLPAGNVLDIVTDVATLRTPSAPVGAVDADTLQLAADMLATMYAGRGVGLAAVQIGRHSRVIVYDASADQSRPEVMIDPKIVWTKKATQPYDEGCLSIPGRQVSVVRPTDVKVAYTDLSGARVERSLGGMPARIVQHEIDHTDGVLITDRLR